MNERQRRALELIGGKSLVDMVQEVGEKATAELERNVAYKAKGDDYPTMLDKFAGKVEDEEAKKGIQSIAKAMRGMPPWLKKPAEDEEEEETEEEKPKKKKQQAETEAPTGTPPAAEAPAEEVPADLPADEKEYRDAVAESFESLVSHFDEQITGLTSEIKALKEIVGQVARDDEQKITEKAMLTPAASLLSTVKRAIGAKETEVDGRTTYAKDGPRMTPPDGGITPIPMLNAFITNEDQRQGGR